MILTRKYHSSISVIELEYENYLNSKVYAALIS